MLVKHVLPSQRIWLVLAAVATGVVFLLSFRVIPQSAVSTAAVGHTQQLSTLVALERAIANLIFASGDEAIARSSEATLTRVNDLAMLTRDNERQQDRLKPLRGEIDAVIRARRRGPGDGTNIRAEAMVPQSLSRTLRELRVEELQLLARRIEASDRTSQRLRATLDSSNCRRSC